jgi:hypothetical protein
MLMGVPKSEQLASDLIDRDVRMSVQFSAFRVFILL